MKRLLACCLPLALAWPTLHAQVNRSRADSLLAKGPALRTDSAFAFMGIPLGSPESTLHDKFSWECRWLKTTPESLDIVMSDRNCSPAIDQKAESGFRIIAFPEWAGIQPRNFVLFYWQGKLSFVRIQFNPAFLPSVLDVLEARYGLTPATSVDTVRTRIGAAFQNRTSRWENSASSITALQYTTSIDESEVWYSLKSWADAVEVRRQQRLKEKMP